MNRYKVVPGSQSNHCCFEATVVDTTRPEMIGAVQYKDQFETVCECFYVAQANMICEALNEKENT